MSEPLPITNIDDPRWARAISHPLRIRLLAMLEETTASPVQLAARLGQPLGTIAYHVRVLADLGLLKLVSTRQRRGATEHYYRAKAHPRVTDRAWSQLDTVSKQRILTAVLDEAHAYASRAAAAGGFDAADAHFTRTPLRLDARGWTKLAKATKRWIDEAARIEQEAGQRISNDGSSSIDVGLVVQLFQALPFSAEPSVASPHHSRASARRNGDRRAARPGSGD